MNGWNFILKKIKENKKMIVTYEIYSVKLKCEKNIFKIEKNNK